LEKQSSPGEPCSDCKGLVAGTRSNTGPHEYLVLAGRGNREGNSLSYRCLVCKTDLTYEPEGRLGRWK